MYSLQELVTETGVKRGTIKYWICLRLVAPAIGRGRAAYYTDQHIRDIRKVQRDYYDAKVTWLDLRDRYAYERGEFAS